MIRDLEYYDSPILRKVAAPIDEITDEKLLKRTNGVVQGMSGSPIIQDGKLIGAVTHVVVDDSSKGYGIFITSMLKEIEN